jgi:single-strand DNA-binding protein
MNKVILQGNVGKEPELRIAASGTAVLKMTVATNDRRKNKEGEYEDNTQWHNVTAFGKTAEFLSKNATKGTPVLIEGKIEYSKVEKDGETKYFTNVLADRVDVFGKREKSAAGSTPTDDSDEIPF